VRLRHPRRRVRRRLQHVARAFARQPQDFGFGIDASG
jgi:cyanophycinase-like exopeptidase